MWSIVVDELLEKLANTRIKIQGYAYGVVISRGKYENKVCDRNQMRLGIPALMQNGGVKHQSNQDAYSLHTS